jgi:hypothetical protein
LPHHAAAFLLQLPKLLAYSLDLICIAPAAALQFPQPNLQSLDSRRHLCETLLVFYLADFGAARPTAGLRLISDGGHAFLELCDLRSLLSPPRPQVLCQFAVGILDSTEQSFRLTKLIA